MAPTYLMDVPTGEVRTTINPPSNAGEVIPTGVALTVLAFIAVCLRLFTRKYVVKSVLGLDDYMCICALIFAIVFLGLNIHMVNLGAGLHGWDILWDVFTPHFWQTSIGSIIIYAVSIAFSKLSVLGFLLRISPDRGMRRAIFSLFGLVCVYTLVYTFLMVFRCRPVTSGWDPTIKGKCIDSLVPMFTLSIANIIIDVLILVLPIKIVLPLQIPLRQKISLALLFATGGFVCVAAIKRTVIVVPLLDSHDYTWEVPNLLIWSFIEVTAGIICASIPALKPFCMRYIPFIISARLRPSQDKSTSAKRHSHSTDKKTRSRVPYGHTSGIHSIDKISESTLQDDEARLWTLKSGDKSCELKAKDRHEVHEMVSFERAAENTELPSVPEPAVVGFGTKRTETVFGGGIQITKETFISYGPA